MKRVVFALGLLCLPTLAHAWPATGWWYVTPTALLENSCVYTTPYPGWARVLSGRTAYLLDSTPGYLNWYANPDTWQIVGGVGTCAQWEAEPYPTCRRAILTVPRDNHWAATLEVFFRDPNDPNHPFACRELWQAHVVHE